MSASNFGFAGEKWIWDLTDAPPSPGAHLPWQKIPTLILKAKTTLRKCHISLDGK